MHLLTTKLTIPILRSRLVARPRLIQKLNQGQECGFVLVSAPAGYGKSTLLSAWLSSLESPAVWYSLDDGDNDPVRFLTYLATALGKVEPAVGESLTSSLQSSSLPAVEILLTPLVNHIAQVKNPFWLVLDDYHLIQNEVVHQAIRFLLEHRPAPLHLMIATRADPPLHLSRLRARSEMVELRLADLRFSFEEAVDFFNHTMGSRILPEEVARITARTEGWIAGLQIAALSMQNADDVSGFIDTFTGSHHPVFDYLLEEILERQSPEIRRFLLYTSILNQLTASLCDALLQEESGSTLTRPSTVILEELEHANLFILPLDHEQRWYRYHHLFSDLLRLMLDKAYPGVSTELHSRACRWYETQDMLPEALLHAISSGNMQLVAQIIAANVLLLLENDEVAPTLGKIDTVPLDKMISLPWLGIARAWVIGTGQVQKSHQLLDAVEKSVENSPDTSEYRRLKGHIAAARAFVFSAQGDKTNVVAHARLANELLPADEIAVRALNLVGWGDVLSVERHDPNAMPILEQAMALALQSNKPHVIMIAAGALASAHLGAGRLHELHRVCLDALEIGDDYQKRYQRPLSAMANVHSLLARVLAEWGENEKAIQFARKGLELSERWGQKDLEVICLDYLGRALALGNDWEQAQLVFQRAYDAAQKISSWLWQMTANYILDTLLDSETPDAGEIARLRRCIEERGAQYPILLKARLLLKEDQPDQALLTLEQELLELSGQPSFDIVRIHALRALAFQAKGDQRQAMAALQQALEFAEPERRIATFVREGAAMEKLLQLAKAKAIAPEFARQLLAAFEARRKHKPAQAPVVEALVEPLSEREMDVLKLLEQGCSDKEIAGTLVIARETVHKHLKNIYGKLNVHSRTGAIARARTVGLL